VLDVQKAGDIFFHVARVCSGMLHVGDAVTCEVDLERRMDIARNHTATHVLHHFLHKVLGKHAEQSGSKVDRDRFSLDFTHFRAMTKEEIAQVESLANKMILQDLPVSTDITTPSEARQRGAMALFGEKYGEEVRLVSVGEASKELCGGTHVSRTGQIGIFKILSEESVAAGIRRIVATSGTPAYEHTRKQEEILIQLKESLRVPAEELPQRIHKLTDQVKSLELEVKKARDAALSGGSGMSDVQEVNGIRVLTAHVGEASQKDLLAAGDRLKSKADVLVLGSQDKDKACLVCWVLSKEALAQGVNAGKIIQQLSVKLDGKGGGNPEMARGGGKDPNRLSEVLASALAEVKACCQ
jgi:alanyl-tRNA synthetase